MSPTLVIFILTFAVGNTFAYIDFKDNGYDNVVVSISPDLGEEQAVAIIAGIQVSKLTTLTICLHGSNFYL